MIQQNTMNRYANVYTISNNDIVKKLQGLLTRFVDGNFRKHTISKDTMLLLADSLEQRFTTFFSKLDNFENIKNIEVLLVRTRNEEMIDFIKENEDSPVILQFSIAQERFINMCMGDSTKEMVLDGFQYEYSPYVMQLILTISKNDAYSGKYLQNASDDVIEKLKEQINNVLITEIKKKAKNFVKNELTDEVYTMHNIAELFNQYPYAMYIQNRLLNNNDEWLTVFIQEVKHVLKTAGKYQED